MAELPTAPDQIPEDPRFNPPPQMSEREMAQHAASAREALQEHGLGPVGAKDITTQELAKQFGSPGDPPTEVRDREVLNDLRDIKVVLKDILDQLRNLSLTRP